MSWVTVDKEVEQREDEVYEGYSGITKTGAYPVKITMAKVVPSGSSSAESIVLDFETKDGKTVSRQFWISNKKGLSYYVYRTGKKVALPDVTKINALATILGFDKPPKRKTSMVEEYDFEEKGMKKVEREVYPELIGKFVGICVVMVMTNKQVKQGDDYVAVAEFYTNPEVEHFYRVKDGKFAFEIKQSIDAEQLDKWTDRNKETYVRDKRTVKGGESAASTTSSSSEAAEEPKKEEEDSGGW